MPLDTVSVDSSALFLPMQKLKIHFWGGSTYMIDSVTLIEMVIMKVWSGGTYSLKWIPNHEGEGGGHNYLHLQVLSKFYL
jgi:hypothetical protein